MSEIRATTISDETGNGPIALTKQIGTKIYCSIDQTSTQNIRDSFGAASIVDNGTGVTTINYTSSMSSVDYGFTSTKGRTGAQSGGCIAHSNVTTPTASLIRIICFKENFTGIDDEYANVAINGDLA